MNDFYFNPNYARVYEGIEGVSETFEFECEFGRIKNTYIKRKIPISVDDKCYYDIITPYGYGGPIICHVTDISKLMVCYKKAFTDYCISNNIVAEFIRFHLFDNIDVRENFYGEVVKASTNVVVNITPDYNAIWNNFDRKVRKNVNKAIKSDLSIIIENNIKHLDDFMRIYNSTMDRNHATSYYYFHEDFFKNISILLPNNFVYFHVLKDNKIISTELVLFSVDYAYSFLGGTDTEYYEYRPNDFLKNEIIKWCVRENKKKFILGGGYKLEDGIYRYKKCFTPDPDVDFYVGKCIYNNIIYDKLVDYRKNSDTNFDSHSNYFPLYRA